MSYNDLVIINNEKISNEKNSFYCDNIDIKSIPENLNKNFNVTVIARNSKVKRTHPISLKKIETASNIFSFLSNVKIQSSMNVFCFELKIVVLTFVTKKDI